MSDLKPGQLVRIADGRQAIVRYIGDVHFRPGDWVGVELDEKTGKNDGSVQGTRYFDCRDGYGMFIKPVTLSIIEEPPPASKPAPARKAARLSSIAPAAATLTKAGGAQGSALSKRQSLNGQSPSPLPRQSRPLSLTRVSFQGCNPFPYPLIWSFTD